jgi:hypothetical protein
MGLLLKDINHPFILHLQEACMLQDVLIIGGGPAGSSAAALLAMRGHRVTILEKEKFPREHVGESLLPFCYDLFKEIGMLETMEKTFVRKPSVRFLTTDGSKGTNWCFNHVIDDDSFLSFQVDRKEFDTLLLDNAARHGATVYQETRVSDVEFDTENDVVNVSAVNADGETLTFQARFLLDASGRSTFMANKNRSRHTQKGLERTALWTHWVNLKHGMINGLEEGNSLIVYLGGEDKKGWSWVFPLAEDRVTVGVVVDSFYLREQKRQIQSDNGTDWAFKLYQQEFQTSPFLTKLLEDATPVMDVLVEGDYSYYSDTKYGDRFAMIGDSGRFIDPIFSSGIYLAMKSSFLVSMAVHKMLEMAIWIIIVS